MATGITPKPLAGAALGVLLALFGTPPHATAQQQPPAKTKAEALYRAGAAAYAQHDLQTALIDFQAVVRLVPASEPAHSSLGVVLLNMRRPKESIPELQQAIKLKPSDIIAQTNLAKAYEQLGQPQKELIQLARVEAITHAGGQTLSADLSAMYARALVADHQLPLAAARLKDASSRDPHNAHLADDLGSIYAMQTDWPKAEQSFRTAITIDPNLASAHLHLGLALEAEQHPEALAELTTAYSLDPSSPVTELELGRALASAGRDDEALPLLSQAHAANPQNADAAYQLALALQRKNRLAEALPLFATVAAAQPANADVLTNYGLALCQQQRAAESVPILQKAVALAPHNPTALENLAAAYVQLNRLDDAVSQLRAALPLNPDSPQLHYNLGLAYKMQDDPIHAIPELQQAEKLEPHQSEARYALGMLYMQAGRYPEAANELSQSLNMQPKNGDGWATLGSVYSKLDKLPDAENSLRQAIAQLPKQPDPHLTLAAVLVEEGKPAEAAAERKLAADLMRSNMNRQRAEVATHTGEGLLGHGDLEGARTQFNDALRFDPTDKDAHAGLARIFDAQGKPAEAAAERAKAASTQP